MRRQFAFVGMALALGTALGAHGQTRAGIPTAHACSVKHFGKPTLENPRVTTEPTFFQDIGAIALGPDGNFYSAAPAGGQHNLGAAFKITPEGALTVLHAFDATTGANPQGGLTYGDDGYYYGTTKNGGNWRTGTVFRIRQAGGLPEILVHFRNGNMAGLPKLCPKCPYYPYTAKQRADAAGAYPVAPPVRDAQGNLYGVTTVANNLNTGTLYKIAPPYGPNDFATLCIFYPGLAKDADKAMAAYVCSPSLSDPVHVTLGTLGSANVLYGTTRSPGGGALFQATTGGHVSLLHQIASGEGAIPSAIMQASDGNLYGTVYGGGAGRGGSIYQWDLGKRAFRTITSFGIGPRAGFNPSAGLVEGKDAKGMPDRVLYGVTRYGGSHGNGTMFKVPLNGTAADLTVVHDFLGRATGAQPMVVPVALPDGQFVGVTRDGGTFRGGVLYRVSHTDYPELTTSETALYGGTVAASDTIVEVRKNVIAKQGGVPVLPPPNFPPGKKVWEGGATDGISVRLACRNPHFVQFIAREIELPGGGKYATGNVTLTNGETYPLSKPSRRVWRTDGSGWPNPFIDQGNGVGRSIYQAQSATHLSIWDQPLFGDSTVYDPAKQTPTGERWRAIAKVYALCDCEVVREIGWTLQVFDGKQEYINVSVKAVTHKTVAPSINALLTGTAANAVSNAKVYDTLP